MKFDSHKIKKGSQEFKFFAEKSAEEKEDLTEGREFYKLMYESVGYKGICHEGIDGAIYLGDQIYITRDGRVHHE